MSEMSFSLPVCQADYQQLELLKQISADPENLVIGINRNPDNAKAVIESELPGRTNIKVVKGDLDDRESLKVGMKSH